MKHIRITVYREWNGDGIKRNKFRQTTGALHETAMIIYLVFRSMINLILFDIHFPLKKKKTTGLYH